MERPELRGTAMFDLTGRVALVTGAGRRLGRSMALALAAAGADVAVSARTTDEIESLAEEDPRAGQRRAGVHLRHHRRCAVR
ncbi:MAG: SDR family NAD(P)-dependent oxidoreductase, partial [Tepidiformaceae bacterium]